MLWDEYLATWYTLGFHRGDKILFTRNDWSRGVMNGSIGYIKEVLEQPRATEGEGETVVALARVDGEDKEIYRSDVENDGTLELGYAITVHKAQGSQFDRVIVPIRGRLPYKNVDMTWVYTAVTRSVEEVILVGNESALREAVERGSEGHRRQVGLHDLLARRNGMAVRQREDATT